MHADVHLEHCSGLQWLARINLLLSENKPDASMTVSIETQQIVKECRKYDCSHLVMQQFGDTRHADYLCPVVFADASLRNRPDGSSTGGYVACLGTVESVQGGVTPLSPLAWRSWKLERKVSASNHAEVQACTVGESLLFRLRVLWSGLTGGLASPTVAKAEFANGAIGSLR